MDAAAPEAQERAIAVGFGPDFSRFRVKIFPVKLIEQYPQMTGHPGPFLRIEKQALVIAADAAALALERIGAVAVQSEGQGSAVLEHFRQPTMLRAFGTMSI